MPRYDVEAEITYTATVTVEATSRHHARQMADRGPAAWLDPHPSLSHCHTEALSAERQDGEPTYQDEMQAHRDRQEDDAA